MRLIRLSHALFLCPQSDNGGACECSYDKKWRKAMAENNNVCTNSPPNNYRERPATPTCSLLFTAEAGLTQPALRGRKCTPYEGGTRTAAFVSGGWLPARLRGTRSELLMHVAVSAARHRRFRCCF